MVKQRAAKSGASGKSGGRRGKVPSELTLWLEGLGPWLPLILVIVGGVALYLLSQVESLKPTLGLLGGLVVIVGGVVYGMMHPEDAPVRVGKNRFQPLVIGTSLLIVVASLYPFLQTNFRGTPQYAGTLSPRAPHAAFDIDSNARLLEVVAHGQLKGDSGSASGGYELVLKKGRQRRHLAGEFKRTYSLRKIRRGRARVASTSAFTYHVSHIPSFGAGHYELELLGVDSTLRNHLRVQVYDTIYDEKTLWAVFGGLLALGLLTDVLTARVRHRTRLAQGALTSCGFAMFFVIRMTPDSILATTVGGTIMVLLGGSVLGWVFGRVAQSLGKEPRIARATVSDDD